MELWFDTHATSTGNSRGAASGHLGPDLSAIGRLHVRTRRCRFINPNPARRQCHPRPFTNTSSSVP